MNSVILRTAAVFILPLLLMFSIIVLLRGHNEPGGGFVGGLLAAAAFVLYMLAAGVTSARRLARVHPLTLAGVGLLAAIVSGLIHMSVGGVLFDAIWTEHTVLQNVKIGTPLLFDIGVYLTVSGVVLAIAFEMAESAARDDAAAGLPDGGTSA